MVLSYSSSILHYLRNMALRLRNAAAERIFPGCLRDVVAPAHQFAASDGVEYAGLRGSLSAAAARPAEGAGEPVLPPRQDNATRLMASRENPLKGTFRLRSGGAARE
jgi:hypothetical protein